MNFTEETILCGTPCIHLSAGGYDAYIAYNIGSNVIRLTNSEYNAEIFRFSEENTEESLLQSAEVWGLPTLYLPNRFADGVLKTSDHTYQLPVNEAEPYHNHIHGFIHKRAHTVVEHHADDNCCVLRTRYVFDQNDPFYMYLPIAFTAEYTFTLSAYGLEHKVEITNRSQVKLPISLATHTALQAPFINGAKEEDLRICVPVGKKCELNERCLPTERFLDHKLYDLEYKNGTKCPVLQVLDNDMYFAEETTLDGQPFHGVIVSDAESGVQLCYESSQEYGFWIIWNDRGFNHYFCPEPMTAMIDAPNLNMDPSVTGYREIGPRETFEANQRFFLHKDETTV